VAKGSLPAAQRSSGEELVAVVGSPVPEPRTHCESWLQKVSKINKINKKAAYFKFFSNVRQWFC